MSNEIQKAIELTTELRECPFCGSYEVENIRISHQTLSKGDAHWKCNKCKTNFFIPISGDDYENIAITAWNTRSEPEARALTIEELQERNKMPVYCKGIINAGLTDWGIVNTIKKRVCDGEGDWWDFDEYGENFLAFDKPPKERTTP